MSTGDASSPQTYTVTRADLVAYAGASGDLNPIHQDRPRSPAASACPA